MQKNFRQFHELTPRELEGYSEAIEYSVNFYKELFNIDLFICYGTLLGSVREKNFIMHDYDVDLSYISKNNNDESIAKESALILTKIINREIPNVTFYSGNLAQYKFHVKNEKGTFVIEIFLSFIKENKFYHYYTLSGQLDLKYILPLKKYSLNKFKFNGPNGYDEYLQSQYGKKWLVPDPNFEEDRTEINFKPFMNFLPQKNLGKWNTHYRKEENQNKSINHSAIEIKKYLKSESIVLDIGCGLGIESNYFSNFVTKVIGIDYSGVCINLAENKYLNNKKLNFEKISISNLTKFKKFNNQKLEFFDFIYCSNFLNSIDIANEFLLYSHIEKLLKPNGVWILEASIDLNNAKEISLKKNTTNRLISKQNLEKRLLSMGFSYKYLSTTKNFINSAAEETKTATTILEIRKAKIDN